METSSQPLPRRNPRVGFVSLGCPKALVDSERILTQLRVEGYDFAPTYEGADVVIVNTCGFLDSARDESLGAIGEAMMATNGRVIVTGCLGAHPEKIREKYPNVLAITGPAQYESVLNAVHAAIPPQHHPFEHLIPPGGVKLTPRHYAYLKISEGCNNRCSFCIIPELRGDLRSRPIGDVLREAERLVEAGVRELLVISQDTSAYGVDVKYAASEWRGEPRPTKFIELAKGLGELDVWVRLHYVYPYPHVDEVIPLMNEGKILPYLDIPFQHASPKILRNMRRPANADRTLDRILRWRMECPDLTLRSTFIVGFPGETDEDFKMLLDFVEEAQIDRAGCFKYEAVEGAAANALPDQVEEEVKEERWHQFMMVQQRVSAARLERKVGQLIPVIIDSVEDDEYVGRSEGDAPEIDGVVRLVSDEPLQPGDIVLAEIEESDEYDLYGNVPPQEDEVAGPTGEPLVFVP